MTFTLLYIRYRQLIREINGLGLYLLFFIFAGGYLAYYFYRQFELEKNAMYVIAFLAIACLALQFQRKDKAFIYKHISNPYLQVFSEYVALTFPFAITCIFTKSWYSYPLLLLLLCVIPLLNVRLRQNTVFKNLSLLIPAGQIEWISGIRKNYITFSFLYLAAVVTCWIKILPLFFLWMLTIIITSFQQEAEPLQVLREGFKSPQKFISDKLKVNTFYMIVLYAPLLIVNTLFNHDSIVINLLFIPAQLSVVFFAVCFKYSSYMPGKITPGNNIPLAIVSMGSALPYLLPVPAILSFLYFNRAKHNLKKYLDD